MTWNWDDDDTSVDWSSAGVVAAAASAEVFVSRSIDPATSIPSDVEPLFTSREGVVTRNARATPGRRPQTTSIVAPSDETSMTGEPISAPHAARRNPGTDEAERFALRSERRKLVDASFVDGLTPQQERRLAYVNWCLDRHREPEIARDLEDLEKLAQVAERVAERVVAFRHEVQDVAVRMRQWSPRGRSGR